MNIYNITIKELEQYFETINEKKFKAIQIYDWLYRKRITSFNDMTNIKKTVIQKLNQDFLIDSLKILHKNEDKDVSKYLFELKDKNKIEAVLMNHDYGNSLCISTQVGCNMSCSFCESGRLKKVRNLEIYEMVLQFLKVEEEANIKITHVVLMGIGEPFDNYDNVIKFIDIINNPYGIGLGSRHITVSTSGVVPKILDFIENGKQVNLAISLHAPNDELRNKLMPINKVYNISEVIKAVKKYVEITNRKVTFEYILLRDVNDTKECALELSRLLKGINCYVNLIPYNETTHIEYKKTLKENILKFYDVLKKNKINVTIRREFGSKVNAACGQLRSNYEEGK
ncbi:MAG: 23S rRNA (adenine(2503)-C(2))-methyltransferase RlmN [Clostridium sp.]|nr:23S rRNA (adenine(2503)-C(2))-methyltransferase RlmN [Clostridium sp.]MCM1444640.1 23S rRNA (adenine(2503)-C(2))-methyltransferase RlmN [Candidatus Amulumruptor caecigallinarius]